MFYVYLLKDKLGKFYVGYSKDLRRRMQEHLAGLVKTTLKMKDPGLIYYEAYLNNKFASERERKLKQYGSAYHGLLKRLKL